MNEDDLKDTLRARGIDVEAREPSAIENLLGSGLGSLGGQLVAKGLRLGWLGTGLAGLAGGALGLLAVKYRVRLRRDGEPGAHRVGEGPGDDGRVFY